MCNAEFKKMIKEKAEGLKRSHKSDFKGKKPMLYIAFGRLELWLDEPIQDAAYKAYKSFHQKIAEKVLYIPYSVPPKALGEWLERDDVTNKIIDLMLEMTSSNLTEKGMEDFEDLKAFAYRFDDEDRLYAASPQEIFTEKDVSDYLEMLDNQNIRILCFHEMIRNIVNTKIDDHGLAKLDGKTVYIDIHDAHEYVESIYYKKGVA